MPSFVPRSEPVKKQDQLAQRTQELQRAILNTFSPEKSYKAVAKYRHAQLSLLKAKTHVINDKEFQNKIHNLNTEKIDNEIYLWTNKTEEEITREFKITQK